MIAEYLMVDDKALQLLKPLKNRELISKLFEIEDSGEFEFMDIDKIWDALHFFLAGCSASRPVKGNPLSAAIVGVHNFNEGGNAGDADFIDWTENRELPGIVAALENFDIKRESEKFETNMLKKNDIYPSGIWEDGREQLIGEFESALNGIRQFYKKALSGSYHIVVRIL
jgi:hypothetical protein